MASYSSSTLTIFPNGLRRWYKMRKAFALWNIQNWPLLVFQSLLKFGT
jgi:hypothetical protein